MGRAEKSIEPKKVSTADYLTNIGVPPLPPRTAPFDPGYDPLTVESHLEQSSHLMSMLKISMAGWQIARESATRRKFDAARKHGVPTVTGGGPFEVAVAQGQLGAYLELCAHLGAVRIECGEGFTDLPLKAREIVAMADALGLEVQFEVGKKHGGAFGDETVDPLIAQGQEWLDAGARQVVVEGRESAQNVGLFNEDAEINSDFADRFANAFGLSTVVFEAPTKSSQFALLNHFGPLVELCNVRLEELLRVEIYRRGLHSDAFLVRSCGHRVRPRRRAEIPARRSGHERHCRHRLFARECPPLQGGLCHHRGRCHPHDNNGDQRRGDGETVLAGTVVRGGVALGGWTRPTPSGRRAWWEHAVRI